MTDYGADPALVASQSSQQVVSTKGFDPGDWVLEFEAPVGTRLLRGGYFGITNFDGMWWKPGLRRWIDSPDAPCSTHAPCKSVAAFRSHLRRHPELHGTKVCLVSRFLGHNVWAIPLARIEAGTAETENTDSARKGESRIISKPTNQSTTHWEKGE